MNGTATKRSVEIIDIFNIFFGGVLGQAIKRIFEGAKVDEVLTDKIKKMEADDPRAALFTVILSMGEKEIANWMEHHKQFKDKFMENKLVQSVAKALPKKNDGSFDWDKALSALTELSSMKQDDFEKMVELLNHDPLFELIRKGLHQGKRLGLVLADALGQLAGLIVNTYQQLDAAAEKAAVTVNNHKPGLAVRALAAFAR